MLALSDRDAWHALSATEGAKALLTCHGFGSRIVLCIPRGTIRAGKTAHLDKGMQHASENRPPAQGNVPGMSKPEAPLRVPNADLNNLRTSHQLDS